MSAQRLTHSEGQDCPVFWAGLLSPKGSVAKEGKDTIQGWAAATGRPVWESKSLSPTRRQLGV